MSSSKERKRSRWGNPVRSNVKEEAAEAATVSASTTLVSDDAALQALLSSAQTREAERQTAASQQRKQRPRNDQGRRRPPPPKKARPSDQHDASYYGPPGREQEDGGGARRRNDNGRSRESLPVVPSSAGEEKVHSSSHSAKDDEKEGSETTAVEKQKPNFGLSGALATKDKERGRMYKGVLLKFQEPPEARAPNTLWRLYVYKGENDLVDTLHISKQSAYLLGRNEEIADIPLLHPSCSSQHAVLQYRALPSKETGKLNCQPYLMDLESTNGSFLNDVRIDPARYYQLKKGDVLRFGASQREYVLLTANTTSIK